MMQNIGKPNPSPAGIKTIKGRLSIKKLKYGKCPKGEEGSDPKSKFFFMNFAKLKGINWGKFWTIF